jgi:hypothetical protein
MEFPLSFEGSAAEVRRRFRLNLNPDRASAKSRSTPAWHDARARSRPSINKIRDGLFPKIEVSTRIFNQAP